MAAFEEIDGFIDVDLQLNGGTIHMAGRESSVHVGQLESAHWIVVVPCCRLLGDTSLY